MFPGYGKIYYDDMRGKVWVGDTAGSTVVGVGRQIGAGTITRIKTGGALAFCRAQKR